MLPSQRLTEKLRRAGNPAAAERILQSALDRHAGIDYRSGEAELVPLHELEDRFDQLENESKTQSHATCRRAGIAGCSL